MSDDDILTGLFDEPQPGREHSLLGASSASRWMNCPGSFRLSQQVPASPPSRHAARGTLAHTFIEQALRVWMQDPKQAPPVVPPTGDVITVDGHDVTVDEDFAEGINTMLDYVAKAAPAFALMNIEHRLSLASYFPANGQPPVAMFGTADVMLASRQVLEIIDYKNGSGVIVDPRGNPQCLYYAAGAVADLHRQFGWAPDLVKLTIVQPHARAVDKVRTSFIDFLDLMLWVEEELIPGVDRVTQTDAPLVPGPWCRFCPASAQCPALIEKATILAQHEFEDFTLVDTNELSRLLDLARDAKPWIAAIEAQATTVIQSGVSVPNWSLTPSRPVRKWTDTDIVEKQLDALCVPDIHTQPALKSPAQIEKLLKRQGRTAVWQHLSSLVNSASSGVRLHRDGTMEDFDDVE